MKVFKFSLQALRTLRERQEQTALQDYGKALQASEQARRKLESAQQELEVCWAGMRKKVADKCSAAELSHLTAHSHAVEKRRKECEHAAKVAANSAKQAFIKLLAARQARGVVDKLFEAEKRRHQREQRRREQKQLDDLAQRENPLTALLQLNREPLWN